MNSKKSLWGIRGRLVAIAAAAALTVSGTGVAFAADDGAEASESVSAVVAEETKDAADEATTDVASDDDADTTEAPAATVEKAASEPEPAAEEVPAPAATTAPAVEKKAAAANSPPEGKDKPKPSSSASPSPTSSATSSPVTTVAGGVTVGDCTADPRVISGWYHVKEAQDSLYAVLTSTSVSGAVQELHRTLVFGPGDRANWPDFPVSDLTGQGPWTWAVSWDDGSVTTVVAAGEVPLCDTPDPNPVKVTPTKPAFVDGTCEAKTATVTPSTQDGVVWSPEGSTTLEPGESVTYTATPAEGHVFPEEVKTKWTFTNSLDPSECDEDPGPVEPADNIVTASIGKCDRMSSPDANGVINATFKNVADEGSEAFTGSAVVVDELGNQWGEPIPLNVADGESVGLLFGGLWGNLEYQVQVFDSEGNLVLESKAAYVGFCNEVVSLYDERYDCESGAWESGEGTQVLTWDPALGEFVPASDPKWDEDWTFVRGMTAEELDELCGTDPPPPVDPEPTDPTPQPEPERPTTPPTPSEPTSKKPVEGPSIETDFGLPLWVLVAAFGGLVLGGALVRPTRTRRR